ncbi:ribonuclease HII [Candidatus Saccharibacteria bacterium CPR2]|nr:ribonuclease HII [Candidatus Saccharibacteria bacterium CPR2]
MISVGIDEVGRGAWAGPLVVTAVALDLNIKLPRLKDSKKLSSKQRVQLEKSIRENAHDIAIAWVPSIDIDEVGLGAALGNAMREALNGLNCHFGRVIVDGNVDYVKFGNLSRAVVRADDQFPEVSAASIVAKVSRDNYMRKMSLEYKEYGFEKNVGYGTKQHLEALQKHGPIKNFHRFSFKPISELAK